MNSKANIMKTWLFFHAQRGFTLLEAMVTVAILAILVSIGVPNFRDMAERYRVTTVANDLLYYLQLARSEAVKRNRAVILCPTIINGTTCSTDVSHWSSQWIVIDGAHVVRVNKVINGVTIGIDPNTIIQVQFSAVGTVSGGTVPNFTVTVDDKIRHVCLRISGAARVSTVPCAPAEVEE